MHLVFAPDIAAKDYVLNKEESMHIIKVLRQRMDDKIMLTDGKGNFYTALIMDDNSKGCGVKIIETTREKERGFALHIAIAPTKNMDRMEWFVEKAVEIGIDEITPIICTHSERKVVRMDRLEKVMVAAIKQSVKATLPVLNPLIPFKDFIKIPTTAERFIANCEEDAATHLGIKYSKGAKAIVLIGPEGDFAPEELVNAAKSGYQSISLGASRLRTETAGVVACHTINLMNDI